MIGGPLPARVTIQTAIGDFLASILPPGIPIMRGQDNRVPEPSANDFVVFTPMMRTRLSTNVDTYGDVTFTGSISNQILTVTAVKLGSIGIGSTLFGVSVLPFTTIVAGGTGTGGIGTYHVSRPQTVASGPLAAGLENINQAMRVSVQIDIHGPNSEDNAMLVSTLWRDEVACDFFNANYFAITPLYADDARQAPFLNDQEQIEYRWILTAELEVKQSISTQMQFMDEVTVIFEDVL